MSQITSLAAASVKENSFSPIFGNAEFIRKSKLRERLGCHRNTIRLHLKEIAPELVQGQRNNLIPRNVAELLISRIAG